MLILILINIQYLQNVVFSSEEGQNGQNHSSVTHHQLKNPPRQDFASPLLGKPSPLPVGTICKTLLDTSSKVLLCTFSSILNCNLASQKNP